jgi:hypothetical protein
MQSRYNIYKELRRDGLFMIVSYIFFTYSLKATLKILLKNQSVYGLTRSEALVEV